MEEWKPIMGYELYEASDMGRVRNVKTGLILKPSHNKKGYMHVILYKGGKKEPHFLSVHRAVMLAFNPIEDYKNMTVNHIDMDKTNNNLCNLEWMSNGDNIRYSQGVKIKCLTNGEIYDSIGDACRKLGLCRNTIITSCEKKYIRTPRTKYVFEYAR